MKRIYYIVSICLFCWLVSGCIKDDNYAAPNATITGTITDASTGQPLQSGPSDERLYGLETSYTKGTPIPQYFNIQPSGIYNNTAMFAGTYKLYPTDGAFVPLVYTSTTT